MTTVLSVAHTKSKPKPSTPPAHSFVIHSQAGDPLYALEAESKHVQKVVKCDSGQILARIEWRGNNKDLVQIEDSEPVGIEMLWTPPKLDERYRKRRRVQGSDGEKYTWTNSAVGHGRGAYLETRLTCPRSDALIAKYTPPIPTKPQSISFSLPGRSKTEITCEPASILELFPGAEVVGEMLYITSLVALGRGYADKAFTFGGFLRNAVDTFTMNTLG